MKHLHVAGVHKECSGCNLQYSSACCDMVEPSHNFTGENVYGNRHLSSVTSSSMAKRILTSDNNTLGARPIN